VIVKKPNKLTSRSHSLLVSLLVSFVLASVSLPSFVRRFAEYKEAVLNGFTPNESFYFTRIYSIQTPILSAQNSYIGVGNLGGLSNDSLSFPEILQRLAFFEFSQGIYENYIWFSLIFLSFSVLTVVKLINMNPILNTTQNILIHLLAFFTLYLLVSNERVAETEYGFYRVINPQFSLMLWLFSVLIVKSLFNHLLEGRSIRRQIFLGAVSTFIAQFSYIFVFLSLIVVYLLIGAYLFVRKKRRTAIGILAIWFLLLFQWTFTFLIKGRNPGFREASERLGLLESHLPGAFQTVLLCFASILVASSSVAIGYFRNRNLVCSPLTLSIYVSSTALIVTSNSNLVSGKSIQFSDHFEIFAYMNLGLATVDVAWSLLKEKTHSLVVVSICFVLLTYSQVELFSGTYAAKESRRFDADVTKLISDLQGENLVVESPNTADLVPIYSSSKVLFDTRMVSYGFTNQELLLRLYVTRGCPSRLTAEEIRYVYPYYIAPYLEKSERYSRVFSRLGLNRVAEFSVSPLKLVAERRERMIAEDVKNLYLNYGDVSCIALARTYGATGVVLDGSGNWVRVLESSRLKIKELNWANLRYFSFLNN
jgi:hypothetical protein